jgi:ubiquinone biosynthesis protein UbiJ
MMPVILNSAAVLLNRALSYDTHASVNLQKLEDACIQIEIANYSIYILVDMGEIVLSTECPETPNTIIRGPISAFMTLALFKNPREAANIGLRIEGDTAIGEALQNLFFSLNIDWEQWLSTYVGDSLAYQLGDGIGVTRDKTQELLDNASEKTRDYLQSEGKYMPTPTETQSFLNDVDKLRGGIDRLEARLKNLEYGINTINLG